MDFLEYLGIEEQNLLTNIYRFNDEITLFYNLDGIYQKPLNRIMASKEADVSVGSLWYFVRFYFYFSVSSFLRCHLSECLSAITTPRIFLRLPGMTSPNGIQMNITAERGSIRIFLYQNGPISTLKEMTRTMVGSVVIIRISAIDKMHCLRKIWFGSLQKKMILH